MELNKDAIEAAGFKLDAQGKIRTTAGHPVKKEVAEQIAAGAIISNFNLDDLRKKKQRAQANGGSADLVAALGAISPAIALLNVGQTAKIPIPSSNKDGKDPKRAFVMGIVTKLNNLTALGREWAGRQFDSLSDPEGEYFYVTRLTDGEAKERKRGNGKKSSDSKASLTEALAKSKEHLGGNTDTNPEAPEVVNDPDAADAILSGDAVVIAGGQTAVMEEATVIKH
jgi:hypothetical protein